MAVTAGLSAGFGAHLLSPDGYLLNNALSGFYANESLANSRRRAGQRPLQPPLAAVAVEAHHRCGLRLVAAAADAATLGQVSAIFFPTRPSSIVVMETNTAKKKRKKKRKHAPPRPPRPSFIRHLHGQSPRRMLKGIPSLSRKMELSEKMFSNTKKKTYGIRLEEAPNIRCGSHGDTEKIKRKRKREMMSFLEHWSRCCTT